ncbi:hypothetical protein TELCIR_13570 [Teladorsagia circumcincta]|uniref:Uncharacterized protein n=1 Tax=Teladorsagia circumcincta TaxID=45464 RepID=A0A2G9U3Q9_TELCI|nr:hypothetical protein TELCIR_13570 [Teladorsagia circumcincta]
MLMSAVALQLYFGEIIAHMRLALFCETATIDKVIMLSTIGLFYFGYWELRHLFKIPEPAATIIYDTVSMLYFNAEFAPYLVLNKDGEDAGEKLLKYSKGMHLHIFATYFIGAVQASSNGIDAVTGPYHNSITSDGSSPIYVDDLNSNSSYYGDVETSLLMLEELTVNSALGWTLVHL